MNTVDKTIALAFGLMFALVIAVYYIGVTTDLGSFSSAVQQIGYMLTGRNKSGTFQPYPGGASQSSTTAM